MMLVIHKLFAFNFKLKIFNYAYINIDTFAIIKIKSISLLFNATLFIYAFNTFFFYTALNNHTDNPIIAFDSSVGPDIFNTV